MDEKLIINTDDLYAYMKEVEEGGKYKANIYTCSSGVPTIGVGFALLIENDDKWSIRENLFAIKGPLDKAGITLPTELDIKRIENILDNVIIELENDNKNVAKKIVEDNATILNKLTITATQAKELFKITQAEYEGYLINRLRLKAGLTKDKAKEIIKSLSMDEKIATYSCVYNALTLIGSGLSNALKNYIKNGISEKDKAYYKTEAWYEIRYNSHKSGWKYIDGKEDKKAEGDDGLANRRYKDSLKFGLYGLCNRKQQNLNQATKDGILKFLDSNQGRNNKNVTETIKKYENEFSPSNNDLGNKKQVKIEKILGILRQDPVEQIKTEVEGKGKFLDNVSEEFLKKYDKEYGLILDTERPIYNSITKIEEHTDVLIFPLMDRLVVNMQKEEEKAKGKDDELYKSIKEFINRCKGILEKVIVELGGYKKAGYKRDNNKDLTNLELKKRLIAAFKPQQFNSPDTKKSHEFFKSFITEEDKKKEQAKKEKTKQKAEKRMAEKKNNNQKSGVAISNQDSMGDKKEENKTDGWIVIQKIDGTKYMSRKEYYG
ncbi:hypothetical protein [Selenihalanaerobacter shriftii]|uniref:Uncharacterized protein n=1 Tax=Selenihalanaerobacter shriftii TaxID=142842 RepID=A0A1T4ML39_9FIRM|nr:hypothetical protein [Selenihalanaerobacter shriftii]SJZ67712.1 hypothetical protein SAMN02745118_01508 [Selenihalanaerobacter shriftii]